MDASMTESTLFDPRATLAPLRRALAIRQMLHWTARGLCIGAGVGGLLLRKRSRGLQHRDTENDRGCPAAKCAVRCSASRQSEHQFLSPFSPSQNGEALASKHKLTSRVG